MARRNKKRKSSLPVTVLGILLIGWLAWDGWRFIPKGVRPPSGVEPIEVEMKTTAYCHCRRCCSYKWFLCIPYQKKRSGGWRLKHVGVTASGAMARPGSLAADPAHYPFGTIMYIPGYGYGRVEDTGGAIKGQHIDLYRPNHYWARLWGVRTKTVKVWLPPALNEQPPD